MKLVSYIENSKEQLGLYIGSKVYNVAAVSAQLSTGGLPDTMAAFLKAGPEAMQAALTLEKTLLARAQNFVSIAYEEKNLLAPVPHPTSCRDAYAFRSHVATARKNRNREMLPEFDQYPVFYFSNHNAIIGPGPVFCMPDHFQKLDFELEVAVVIGKKGINIAAAQADAYIAGYMIMNDFSARTLQMEEMLFNLGPAKGKDFATGIGPWLVTPDELAPYKVPAPKGHTGNQYKLDMKCRVNGIEVSSGNFATMDWTFAEIIERCSYGTPLLPGDVIGSGTVGTGCFLELNGTGKLNNAAYKEQWLKAGDKIELEVTGLGCLRNTIQEAGGNNSILALKKN